MSLNHPPSIIITGASEGLGKALCASFLAKGYHTIGISRTLKSDTFDSPNWEAINCDLCKHADLEKLCLRLKELPHIEGLILNAGIGRFKHLEEQSWEEILLQLHTNFLGHLFITKTLLAKLKKQSQAHIIFTGSEAGLQGQKKGSVYCASKFAIRGFSQSLQKECASSNVKVCLINPGMFHSSFYAKQNFCPGKGPSESVSINDLIKTFHLVLEAQTGSLFEEINLIPQKKVLSRNLRQEIGFAVES